MSANLRDFVALESHHYASLSGKKYANGVMRVVEKQSCERIEKNVKVSCGRASPVCGKQGAYNREESCQVVLQGIPRYVALVEKGSAEIARSDSTKHRQNRQDDSRQPSSGSQS